MLWAYILIASGLKATTYGYGELNCGDTGSAKACVTGQPTASGVPLDPDKPMAAVAAPSWLRIPAGGLYVWAQLPGGPCKPLRVVDKMNPRFIGERGWDLTPAAVSSLGGQPSSVWSSIVSLCRPNRKDTFSYPSYNIQPPPNCIRHAGELTPWSSEWNINGQCSQ